PEPRHLATALHQRFTDGGDVVLGVARRHARRAPRALRQVDREAPARMIAAVVAEIGLFLLALRPPLDRLFGVLGRLFVMEGMIAGAQRPGFGERQQLSGAEPELARAAFGRDDLAMLSGLGGRRSGEEGTATVRVGLHAQQLER